MKSKVIAISAISAGFIAILLTIGVYVDFFDLVAVVFASIFVVLPLYYNSFKGSFLAFLAGGVIAFLCGLGNIYSVVFPAYFVFFGLYPIIRFIAERKNFNKWLFYFIGLIWCVGVCYGLFFYYTEITMIPLTDFPKFILDNIYYFIAPFGIILYALFERFVVLVKRLEDFYLPRILKK